MKNPYQYQGSQRKISFRLVKYIFFSLVILVGISFLYHTFLLNEKPLKNPSQEAGFNYFDVYLSPLVEQNLKDQTGEFAVVVAQLKSDSKEKIFINQEKVLPAGSLYKLFLIAAALRAEENGVLEDDQIITASLDHLVEVLGSKEFGYEDYDQKSLSYSVSEILNRIATISDNYAAIMLAEKLGWDKVQAEVNAIGAKSTKIKSPISTSASDIALFFQKLYQKQVVSEKVSERIIDLLEKARINNRIPAGIPNDVVIAHKTGELSGVRNDAGIVYLDNNPYLIVMLSNNLKYEDDGVEILAKISKDVYQYFSSNAR